jgi:hypothetical protein
LPFFFIFSALWVAEFFALPFRRYEDHGRELAGATGFERVSFAKTPQRLKFMNVACYTASLDVVDFKCAPNFGEAQAPVFLKKNQRIEALMFVYFLAQLVCALIERQLRNAMREHGLPHIQILPEDRPSTTPTTEQVIRVFSSRARHLLLSKDGELVQTFTDPLSSIQEQILDLLSIFPSVYA